MKFKEFLTWCNERACDGEWGASHAVICTNVIRQIKILPFWKRENEWKKWEKDILDCVVTPVNKIREQLHQKRREEPT